MCCMCAGPMSCGLHTCGMRTSAVGRALVRCCTSMHAVGTTCASPVVVPLGCGGTRLRSLCTERSERRASCFARESGCLRRQPPLAHDQPAIVSVGWMDAFVIWTRFVRYVRYALYVVECGGLVPWHKVYSYELGRGCPTTWWCYAPPKCTPRVPPTPERGTCLVMMRQMGQLMYSCMRERRVTRHEGLPSAGYQRGPASCHGEGDRLGSQSE